MAQIIQDGLEWEESLFSPLPRWTRDPSVEAIERVCRRHLAIPSNDACTVSFYEASLFAKLYLVDCSGSGSGCRYMMRVSLPVYPGYKTRAEVATLRWVRANTTVPAPTVYAFDDCADNDIGFEWVLLEFIPGTPARKRWRQMSMEQKTRFTERVAELQTNILRCPLRGIGSLKLTDDEKSQGESFPDVLVYHEFFMGDHVGYDIPRGPFSCSHDWLAAVLGIMIQHQTNVLATSDDEDEREDAEEIMPVAKKLLFLLPKLFSPQSSTEEQETTGLCHSDLHLNNILINDDGEISAVLDWECVSALPLWMASQVPKFLDWPARPEEPQRDAYGNVRPEGSTEGFEYAEKEEDKDLDHEGKTSLYWEHKMEHDATVLREVWETKMKQLWPDGWPLDNRTCDKYQFYRAIEQCHTFWVQRSNRWADCFAEGRVMTYEDPDL